MNGKMRNNKKLYKVQILACVLLVFAIMISGCGNQEQKTDATIETSQSVKSSLQGQGTKEEPFQISSADGMVSFAEDVNSGNTYTGQYVALTQDIDMESIENWTMIGNADGSISFAGVFDGAAHKITHLTSKNEQFAGIFTKLNGMVVNLLVEDSVVEGKVCGAIAAVSSETAVIANCYTKASVNGETAGGMLGAGAATLINCGNLATEEMGTQSIVGNWEGSTLMNCYTNRGGSFELENHTSDEVELGNQNRAIQNLNTMLEELSVKYDIADWYVWELGDTRPILSQEKAVLVQAVTREDGTTAQYDLQEHGWNFPILKSISTDPVKFSIQFTDGTATEVTCDPKYEELYYNAHGIENLILCRQDETPESDEVIFADTETIDISLDDLIETPQSDAIEFISVAYLNATGEVQGENTLAKIVQPGKYHVQGSMQGQLLVDLGEGAVTDGNKQAEIVLDQVEIQNTYGPAIKIENVLETGDTEYAGIRLNLADGTENKIDGSNSMNIYRDGDASEGAISTKMTMSISGNTGKLILKSDLEGIESKTRLRLKGGVYDINSAEDGLNIADRLEIEDCYIVIHAGDDVVDSDGEMHVNATMIGSTSIEHFFNARDGVDVDGVFIVGTSSFENGCKDGSDQGLVNVRKDAMFTKGEKIVVTDGADTPLFALEVQTDGPNMVFSFPGMQGKTLHIYQCESVTGTFQDGVCRDITAFEKKVSFTHDGSEEFMIADINNQFVLD